jgi:hypothetical protein
MEHRVGRAAKQLCKSGCADLLQLTCDQYVLSCQVHILGLEAGAQGKNKDLAHHARIETHVVNMGDIQTQQKAR